MIWGAFLYQELNFISVLRDMCPELCGAKLWRNIVHLTFCLMWVGGYGGLC
jgi:hypothetical protein